MQDNVVYFFKKFYAYVNSLDSLDSFANNQYDLFSTKLKSELVGLNPIAADELVADKLDKLKLDTELLNCHDKIREFQLNAMGELYTFDQDHPFVSAVVAIIRRLTGKSSLDDEALSVLIGKLKEALLDRTKVNILESYRKRNACTLNEYRLKRLEKGILDITSTIPAEELEIFGEFTRAQQAIAIRCLFYYVLELNDVDETKLMEFAHLLSARKIPLNKKTGKADIRNSSIKSAFSKTKNKENASHLADLRFVLRYFKLLNRENNAGIQKAINMLEKRIDEISRKLDKKKD